jgi:cytochrome b6-f complex iron-sulfur subunit
MSNEANAAQSSVLSAAKKPTPRGSSTKPAKGKTDERRSFVGAMVAGAWAAFTATCAAMTLGTIRFLYPNVLAEPPSQLNTGEPPDSFEPDSVDTRWKDQFQVWIVHLAEERKLVALSTICTHLGCSPSWLPAEQKFKCPCHGSGFRMNGINFEGPAPRPLERFRIYEIDGVVVVDKSRKFQHELGQWTNPDSYLSTG